ncbi:14741_t:CDS:2, partial [Cetraspora pellucida]
RSFKVPIMHIDKEKQEVYVNENVRSGDHNDSILVNEVLESESKGKVDNKNIKEEKVSVDKKLSVKNQLVRIVDSLNIEAQYKANIKQLFKANKVLFANGLEELRKLIT